MSFARRFVVVCCQRTGMQSILIDQIGICFKDITQSTVVTPTNKKFPL